jgi:DNA-binding CsgD family transcriptional regulator
MSKSGQLRPADARAIFRLVGECRDLGDEPVAWRQHLFRGLARLTAAGVALGGEMQVVPGAKPRGLGTTEVGWEGGFDRAGWVHSLAEFDRDPGFSPLLTGYLHRFSAADGICLARESYLRDDEWYRSVYYADVQEVIGIDSMLTCFHSLAAGGGHLSGVILGRAAGDRPFGRREELVVQVAHAALAPLIGGPLARFAEPSPSALPPRARDVLRCLLEGDGDKQIAARLGLRPLTVNGYVKQIYAHFGVSSRGELLARWVRRAWSSGRPGW